MSLNTMSWISMTFMNFNLNSFIKKGYQLYNKSMRNKMVG